MVDYIFQTNETDNYKFKISIYREQLRYDIIKKIIKIFIDHIKNLKAKYKLDLYKFLKIKIIPYVQIWCWLQYKNKKINDVIIPYISDETYNFDEYIEDVNYSLKKNIPSEKFNDLKHKIKTYLSSAYEEFKNKSDKTIKISKEINSDGDIILLSTNFNGENRSIKVFKDIYERLKSKYIMIGHGDKSDIDIYIYCICFRYGYIDGDMQQLAIHPNIKYLMKKANVNFELFGSGINTISDRYCSLFYDIEKYFGSAGNFFSIDIKQGIYWCNPPYINSLMQKCSEKLVKILQSNKNVGFIMTIPIWDNYTQKIIKDKILKNHNLNIDQSNFTDYPCYHIIKPYIKYELIIPKYTIPYFSFKYNESKYASDTYMIYVAKDLEKEHNELIIKLLDEIFQNYSNIVNTK